MARKTQQNQITSPELLAQINEENKTLRDDFLIYIKSTGRSETTLSEYRSNLNIFFCWNVVNNKNKVFTEVKKRDFVKYQTYLIDENKNSPARVRGLKAVLSSLSNYIENVLDEEYKDFRSQIKKVESPVIQKVREKTVFSNEDLERLLDHLVEKGKYQQACAVALAMCSGVRKSEITRFKVSYFKPENIIYDSLYKTPEKIKTKGRGNGKFINKYTLVNPFQKYLDLWLEERNRLEIDSDWLFVVQKEDGCSQLTVAALNAWTKSFTTFLKLDFYWHSLRHYFTTHLARQGLPDGLIQSIVGWDSADMVGIYKDIPVDEEIGDYFSGGKIVNKPETNLSKL